MKKNKCDLCKYEWESRVDKPAQCPRCKRYDWNKHQESMIRNKPLPPDKLKKEVEE